MSSLSPASKQALKKLKFSFVGLGVMASHFLEPLLQEKIILPENVIGTQHNEEASKRVQEKFPDIHMSTDNQMAAREGDIVFLGCKPPDLFSIAQEIDGGMKPDSLIVSMLAAIPSTRIGEVLQHSKVCRCIPNTPVKIREGVIPYCLTPQVPKEHKELMGELFSTLGESIYLAKETQLDMATAICGSSPAYYFLIMEAMTDAGVHCGLPRRQAELMAMKSMQGSVNFALQQHGKQNFAELKAAVTSPGGTTASALYQAEKNGLRNTIAEVIWACYRRSLEIRVNDSKVYGPGHWEPQPHE